MPGTKAQRQKSKDELERLLEAYGIEYDMTAPGHYRIQGYIYNYWCRGYTKGGWTYYDSHTDFLTSLIVS